MSAEEMVVGLAEIPRLKKLGACRKREGIKDTLGATNYTFHLDQAPKMVMHPLPYDVWVPSL